MKYIIKLLFLAAFLMPFTNASADTHEDATMDVLEHVDAAEVDHDVKLPEIEGERAEVTHSVDLPEHANDDAEDKVNESHDSMEDEKSEVEIEAPEIEAPEVEAPEIEAPEVEAPEMRENDS